MVIPVIAVLVWVVPFAVEAYKFPSQSRMNPTCLPVMLKSVTMVRVGSEELSAARNGIFWVAAELQVRPVVVAVKSHLYLKPNLLMPVLSMLAIPLAFNVMGIHISSVTFA